MCVVLGDRGSGSGPEAGAGLESQTPAQCDLPTQGPDKSSAAACFLALGCPSVSSCSLVYLLEYSGFFSPCS